MADARPEELPDSSVRRLQVNLENLQQLPDLLDRLSSATASFQESLQLERSLLPSLRQTIESLQCVEVEQGVEHSVNLNIHEDNEISNVSPELLNQIRDLLRDLNLNEDSNIQNEVIRSSVLLHSNQELEQERHQLELDNRNENKRLGKLERDIENKENEVRQLQKTNKKLERDLCESKTEKERVESKLQFAKKEEAYYLEELRKSNLKYNELLDKHDRDKTLLLELKEANTPRDGGKIQELEKKCAETFEKLAQLERTKQSMEEKYERKSAKTEMLRSEVKNLERIFAEKSRELSQISRENEELTQEVAEAKKKLSEKSVTLEEMVKKDKKMADKLHKQRQAWELLKYNSKAKMTEVEDKLKEKDAENSQLQQEMEKVKTELDSLRKCVSPAASDAEISQLRKENSDLKEHMKKLKLHPPPVAKKPLAFQNVGKIQELEKAKKEVTEYREKQETLKRNMALLQQQVLNNNESMKQKDLELIEAQKKLAEIREKQPIYAATAIDTLKKQEMKNSTAQKLDEYQKKLKIHRMSSNRRELSAAIDEDEPVHSGRRRVPRPRENSKEAPPQPSPPPLPPRSQSSREDPVPSNGDDEIEGAMRLISKIWDLKDEIDACTVADDNVKEKLRGIYTLLERAMSDRFLTIKIDNVLGLLGVVIFLCQKALETLDMEDIQKFCDITTCNVSSIISKVIAEVGWWAEISL